MQSKPLANLANATGAGEVKEEDEAFQSSLTLAAKRLCQVYTGRRSDVSMTGSGEVINPIKIQEMLKKK